MEEHISEMIRHMSETHRQLARTLAAGRDVTVHLSYLVDTIPDDHMTFAGDLSAVTRCAEEVAGSVVAYLNSIGGLEDALAENLEWIMKETSGGEDDEE